MYRFLYPFFVLLVNNGTLHRAALVVGQFDVIAERLLAISRTGISNVPLDTV